MQAAMLRQWWTKIFFMRPDFSSTLVLSRCQNLFQSWKIPALTATTLFKASSYVFKFSDFSPQILQFSLFSVLWIIICRWNANAKFMYFLEDMPLLNILRLSPPILETMLQSVWTQIENPLLAIYLKLFDNFSTSGIFMVLSQERKTWIQKFRQICGVSSHHSLFQSHNRSNWRLQWTCRLSYFFSYVARLPANTWDSQFCLVCFRLCKSWRQIGLELSVYSLV